MWITNDDENIPISFSYEFIDAEMGLVMDGLSKWFEFYQAQ